MGIRDHPDRWVVEWSNGALIGKHVTVRNPNTGQAASGHDWSKWDPAFESALAEADAEGDLVSEIEDYLESS